jgi:hypothetical protein
MMTPSTRQVNLHTSIFTTALPATTAVSMRLPGAELQLGQKTCSGLGCLSMQLVHGVLPDKGQGSVTALLTGGSAIAAGWTHVCLLARCSGRVDSFCPFMTCNSSGPTAFQQLSVCALLPSFLIISQTTL